MLFDPKNYGFIFNGIKVGPLTHGADFVSELAAVLDRFPVASPKRILEWGSGLTTQIFADWATKKWGSDLVLSIDENHAYQEAVFIDRFKPACLKFKSIDLIGPGKSQSDPGLNFSTYPLSLGHKFDLIFIDARRRVECAFVASLLCHQNTIVIVHDYRRTRYQPVVALFEILHDGAQFRVLRLRPKVLDALEVGASGVEMYMKSLSFNGICIADC